MKTVTFDDEAYELLRAARVQPRESFSSVVKRALGRKPTWDDTAGAWSDMTDEEVDAIRASTNEMFGYVGGKP